MGTFRLVHIGAAAALAVASVTALGVVQSMAAPATGIASSLIPIAPCRLVDTRSGSDNVGLRSTPIGSAEKVVFTVRGINGNCDLPATATGISTNVTSVNPTIASFLTLWPADVVIRPTTSSLNWLANGAPNPNAVVVGLSSTGTIAVFNLTGTVDIIIDVVGYYEPTAAGGTPGPTGLTGLTGSAGTNGAPGTPGTGGTNGSNGLDGAAGTAGTPGGTGATGAQSGRIIAATTTLDSAGNVGHDTSIAVGVSGNPIISYRDATTTNLKIVNCNDSACTGSGEVVSTLDNSGDVGQYTSITIGRDSYPVISYWDADLGDLKIVKCNDQACGGADETVSTVDSVGSVGLETSITIGADSLPVISYLDATNLDLRVAKCNDIACTGGNETLTTIDSVGNVGGRSSITIGVDGFPVISYYDATNGNLKVAKCSDAACAGGKVLTAVDSIGDVGAFSSINIGVDANPIISYKDTTNVDLKVAKCSDSACASTTTLTRVDGAAGLAVGDNNAMVLSAAGYPIVSYYDSSFGDLRMLECDDPACSGPGERITVLDTNPTVGQESSITLGTDASPVIASYDAGNGDLKVVKVTHSSWSVNGWGD